MAAKVRTAALSAVPKKYGVFAEGLLWSPMMSEAGGVPGCLVGRDDELARLGAWLKARLAGEVGVPPVFFVSGEAGVGKSSLLDAIFDGLPDAMVHRAAASPWQVRPFGLLRDLVPPGHDALADADALRSALVSPQRPVVLGLDDLHWSDAASLELLGAFVEATVGDPVAVIGAYRGEELSRRHFLRRIRAHLRHRRLLAELSLGPLTGDVLSDLIGSVVGGRPSPGLTAAVAERTEGLPFFVQELLAVLQDSGRLSDEGDCVGLADDRAVPLPDSIRDAVALRVAGLGPAARASLDVAAVCGLEVDFCILEDVTEQTWPEELESSGLLLPTTAGRIRFRHVLVQEALLEDIPWSRRRALHRAIAQRLSTVPDTEVAVARHLLASHDLDRARPALVVAAETQLKAHAHRDAAQLLSAAVEAWPAGIDEVARQAAVDKLAQCWESAGEHNDAITSLRELAHVTDRAEIHRRLAAQYELLGHWPLALSAREAAAVTFAAAGELGESATERLAIAAHLRSAASFQGALDALDVATADATAAGRTDLECRIKGLRGNVLARMGRTNEGIATVEAALDVALVNDLAIPAAEIYQRLADSIEHAGDYDAALHAYDNASSFCEAHDQASAGQLCRACATVVLLNIGHWDRAVELSRTVVEDSTSAPHARAVATGVRGLVFAMRGQAEPARAQLLDSRTTARRIELVAMELLSGWGLALLDEFAGHIERAADTYRHVLARCRDTDERHYCVPVLVFAAARFAHDGAADDLSATAELLAHASARTGDGAARAGLIYALGEAALLEGGTGGRRSGTAQLMRAVEEFTALKLPIVEALVQQRAAISVSTVDPATSTRLLRDAHRTAQQLKARAMARRIAADLEQLGQPISSRRDAFGLTPREGEILRLVGDGLTSRQIAIRLHLSARTVEMHVSNATAALGCTTRAEAVGRLAAASSDRTRWSTP
jgi:DNA-binding CsgD family transcriptional regulator/tetratricopeptide (TPR) repeat protein